MRARGAVWLLAVALATVLVAACQSKKAKTSAEVLLTENEDVIE